MAEIVYLLCAVTSFFCAGLLLGRWRRSRTRLLLWASLCFVGLALNNALLVVDQILVPDTDLSLWRNIPALGGLMLLLYGLIFDAIGARGEA